MITLEHVTKSFRNLHAVKDLSLIVERGEIFGLVGPNGAGKTTTIKMMTGLMKPDSGKILIGNHDIVEDAVKAKSVLGYIPDRAFLYEKLSAREFLIFIGSIYGIKKNTALCQIKDLLEMFGISDVQNELIESFSQGMRQRLLFSSALLHEPEVLLVDEPFMGLDPFGVRMLKDLISGLSAKGVTVFLATHSLHIAEELCHKVGFIQKGSLVSISDSDEMKDAEGGLEGLFLRLGDGA